MMFQVFPPGSTNRDLLLILDIICTIICLEVAMSFLVHAARRDRAWRVNLGWGVVFGGFSLLQASNIPFFFYFPVDVYTQNAQIIGGLGILFVITIIGVCS